MKILVTGSNGLLGQKIIYQLLHQQNHQIIAIGKGENRLQQQNGYTYFNVDISHFESFNNIIQNEKPDAIIHTAAITNVDLCEIEHELCRKVNVDAVQNLATICDQLNIHLIHLSTDFIFDGTAGPYDENAIPNPLSFYGHSKNDAETIVLKMRAPWAIIRTVLVFGITDGMSRSNIVLWVKNSLNEGKTIHVVNDQYRTPTLAEDLAQGCILAAEQKATRIFNISGPDMMNIYELACRVADYFQLDKTLIQQTDSTSLNQPAKRPPKTGFIIQKAEKILGYKPHRFEDSITLLEEQINQMQK